MGSTPTTTPVLSIPPSTFSKLTPSPFLHAHLKQSPPVRPNGRKPSEFRSPKINTGSLTHSNGSAVVRLGDTAVVCGVRGEILLASDIPHHPTVAKIPASDLTVEEGKSLVEQLGLLVPNLELSTGCSPGHLPGNPPGSLAQTLSYRILALMNDCGVVGIQDLGIEYAEPRGLREEDGEEGDGDGGKREGRVVTKGYWVLYVDILCISLDGNAFDAAWIAVMAALKDTVLPKAWWDADAEGIVCSPLLEEGRRLRIRDWPVAATLAVFTTASPLKRREVAESWMLADPDGFEEEICRESVTVVVAPSSDGGNRVMRLEKGGGVFVGMEIMEECIEAAGNRARQIVKTLGQG